MAANLTCTQVGALLSFYVDNKLSSQLTQFVEAHLKICPACRAKCEALKLIVKNLRDAHDNMSALAPAPAPETTSSTAQLDEFQANLSAYIDNELTDEENIKVKKYVISNAKARGDLEKLYNLKKVMHNSFERTKNDVKEDYSKFILKRIDIQEEIYGPDSFAKVVALFVAILTLFTISAAIIFGV